MIVTVTEEFDEDGNLVKKTTRTETPEAVVNKPEVVEPPYIRFPWNMPPTTPNHWIITS